MKDNPGKKPPGGGGRMGFYAAVYSAAGIMLALAVVIGWRNFFPSEKQGEVAQSVTEPETAAVSRDLVSSYLTPSDQAARNTPLPTVAPTAKPGAREGTAVTVPPVATTAPRGVPLPVSTPTAAATAPPTTTAPSADGTAADFDGDAAMGAPSEEVAGSQAVSAAEATFAAFEEGQDMAWPVLGDVVMAYSVDHVVYDKTLDQYRVNDTLCIAADQGAEVRAATAGRVSKIATTRENGKTVTIDNGNGWLTTYSQLQDTVFVNVGDVVAKGQLIGGVGSPSIYSILLGNHLGFAVYQGDTPVNPMDLLAGR